MVNMIAALTLFLLASAPQTTTFNGEWLLTWDQMGTQYIRVSVTQDGAAAKVTWENESFQCALTNNVCEGTVTENDNPKAGKVKITMNGDEIKGKGTDLEGAFTFIGKRPPARLLAGQGRISSSRPPSTTVHMPNRLLEQQATRRTFGISACR